MTVSGCSLHMHTTKQCNIVHALQCSQAMTHTSVQVLILQKAKNWDFSLPKLKYCIQEPLCSLWREWLAKYFVATALQIIATDPSVPVGC